MIYTIDILCNSYRAAATQFTQHWSPLLYIYHRSVCADQALCEASRNGRCPLRTCLSSGVLASLIPESGNTAVLSGCCGGGSLTRTDSLSPGGCGGLPHTKGRVTCHV